MKNSGCATAAFCKVEIFVVTYSYKFRTLPVFVCHNILILQGFREILVGHLNPKTNSVKVLPYGFAVAVKL
jgi:hypothetical protein